MQNQNITLQQLLDHLENGERMHKKFDFTGFNIYPKIESKYPNCGTAGCAIGEMPALDSRWRFNPESPMNGGMIFNLESVNCRFIAEYFGIDIEEAWHLFFPHSQEPHLYGGKHLDNYATIEEVIFNLKEFLKRQNNIKITNGKINKPK
jgi:hypothetical protein